MAKLTKYLTILAAFLAASSLYAQKVTVEIFRVEQSDGYLSYGSVILEDTDDGLLISPNLHSLSPGLHGFHVHDVPSCHNFGQAARGHFDPKNTNRHRGPYKDDGHLGDLPALTFDAKKQSTHSVLAPRLKLYDIQNRALMIHSGGDNYSDTPKSNGGGGDRVACGVIPRVPKPKPVVEKVETKKSAPAKPAPNPEPKPAAEPIQQVPTLPTIQSKPNPENPKDQDATVKEPEYEDIIIRLPQL